MDFLSYRDIQYDRTVDISSYKRFLIQQDDGLFGILPDKPLSLKDMQGLVEGYVEQSPIPIYLQSQEWNMFWNEDAKQKNLPRNIPATDLWHISGGTLHTTIRGDVFMMRKGLFA